MTQAIRISRAICSCAVILLFVAGCTYDSTPPGDTKINDGKPLVMIDATGLGAGRRVEIRVTDAMGTVTTATVAEKTDGSGRFLYPLFLARGTRTYDLRVTVDINANLLFSDTGTDLRYNVVGLTIGSDGEIKNLRLSVADFATF